MDFGERIEELKKEVAKLPPPGAEVESTDQLETVAEVAPAAIRAAWKLVERELHTVGARAGLTVSQMSSGQLILRRVHAA